MSIIKLLSGGYNPFCPVSLFLEQTHFHMVGKGLPRFQKFQAAVPPHDIFATMSSDELKKAIKEILLR